MTETARENDPRSPRAPHAAPEAASHPATAADPHPTPTPHGAPATAASASPAPAPRNARLEALRLVAILSIAVFHTFQPWFAAATDGRVDLGVPVLAALSFKSTSALSLALAVACLVRASAPGRRPSPRACGAILWLTPSILGFYVTQSVFSPLWRPWFEGLCASALAAGAPWALLACGLLLSAALLAVTLVVDRVARVAPLRRLRLA